MFKKSSTHLRNLTQFLENLEYRKLYTPSRGKSLFSYNNNSTVKHTSNGKLIITDRFGHQYTQSNLIRRQKASNKRHGRKPMYYLRAWNSKQNVNKGRNIRVSSEYKMKQKQKALNKLIAHRGRPPSSNNRGSKMFRDAQNSFYELAQNSTKIPYTGKYIPRSKKSPTGPVTRSKRKKSE